MLGGGIAEAGGAGRRLAYVGTYTTGDQGGHGVVTAAVGRGGVLAETAATATPNPSFLALAPSGRALYAVNELTDGAITAFAVGPGGALRAIGTQTSHGADPAHLEVHPSGRYVLLGNYSSGNVVVYPVGADGGLGAASDVVQHTGSGPDQDRQRGPHAHQIVTDPTGRNVAAVDLGADSVFVYGLDLATGRLRPRSQARLRPGAGPRHLAFHPSGRFAYVVNELDSTIVVCAYDAARGELRPGSPQSTLPAGTTGPRNFPAEVLVSPDGRFVYSTNRGHNSVAVFAVEQAGAALRLLAAPSCGGDWPRHAALDPTGRRLYVSNQRSAAVTTFDVDPRTGGLTQVGALPTPSPVCVVFAQP